MSKPVRFHPGALREISSQTDHYVAEGGDELGCRFVREVQKAIGLAAQFPDVGSPYHAGTRRVFPGRFPYSIVYVEREHHIHVLAVAHFRRKPGYWLSRSVS